MLQKWVRQYQEFAKRVDNMVRREPAVTCSVETHNFELTAGKFDVDGRRAVCLKVKQAAGDVESIVHRLQDLGLWWNIDSAYHMGAPSLHRACKEVQRVCPHSTAILKRPLMIDHGQISSWDCNTIAASSNKWQLQPVLGLKHAVLVATWNDRVFYLDPNPIDPDRKMRTAVAAAFPELTTFDDLLTRSQSEHRPMAPHDDALRWRQSRGVCMAIVYWVCLLLISNSHWSHMHLNKFISYRMQQWRTPLSKIVAHARDLNQSHTATNVAGMPLLSKTPDGIATQCAALKDARLKYERTRSARDTNEYNNLLHAVASDMSFERWLACTDELNRFVKLHPHHTDPDYLQITPAFKTARNADDAGVGASFWETQVVILLGFARELVNKLQLRQ